jgi:hypothetical protein
MSGLIINIFGDGIDNTALLFLIFYNGFDINEKFDKTSK